MGAAAISNQTLVVVCGYADTHSFQIVFMTTIFLIVAQFDSELTHSNHRLSRPVSRGCLASCSNHFFQAVMWLNFFLFLRAAMLLSIYPNSDIFPCLIISGYWANDKIRLHSPHSLMGSSDPSLQSLCLLHTFCMLIHSPLLHLNMVGPSHTFSVEKNRAV